MSVIHICTHARGINEFSFITFSVICVYVQYLPSFPVSLCLLVLLEDLCDPTEE